MVRHEVQEPDEIVIAPGKRSNIPAIVDVVIAAYASDPVTQLADAGSSVDRRKALIKELEEVWDFPQLWPLVAKDSVTGEILGLGLWIMFDGSSAKHDDILAPYILRKFPWQLTRSEKQRLVGYVQGSLQDAVQSGLMRMRGEWVTGKRHMYLASLAVLPGAQGKGIGSNLVQAGTDRADRHNDVCFLEATPIGYPLYLHRSFKQVDFLDIDLSHWTGEHSGYGIYRYTAMLRLPSLGKNSK